MRSEGDGQRRVSTQGAEQAGAAPGREGGEPSEAAGEHGGFGEWMWVGCIQCTLDGYDGQEWEERLGCELQPGWWFDTALRGLRTGSPRTVASGNWEPVVRLGGLGVVRRAHQKRRVRGETDRGAGFPSFDKLRTGLGRLRAGSPGTPDGVWLLGPEGGPGPGMAGAGNDGNASSAISACVGERAPELVNDGGVAQPIAALRPVGTVGGAVRGFEHCPVRACRRLRCGRL